MPGAATEPVLDAATEPLCSLALYAGRAAGPIVGRSRELTEARHAIGSARTGLSCVVIEGEPGIGKTRFLLDLDGLAREEGFASVAITADEEIHGPFLLARSLFSCPQLLERSAGTPAQAAVARAIDALSSRTDAGLASMAPDQRQLRTFDLAAAALRALAALQPLSVLIDDLQWGDEDSLRLLRYVARTGATSPIFLALALRPSESAEVSEAMTLIADLERVGMVQHLRLQRFSRLESGSYLERILGGSVDVQTAAVMHVQSEGLPFVLGEQARAYRDAGLLQQIDSRWTLARNAERLLPSAVRTLIQRRANRLPAETQGLVAMAAVLGRNFSLRDLSDLKRELGEGEDGAGALEATLEPAVQAGLLERHPVGRAADYSFTHDDIREYAVATLQQARRRAIHGAVVDMLMSGGEPPPASLSMLAGHALAAGRSELTASAAVSAAKLALAANAPEEALRLVALAQPVTAGAQVRAELLRLRDDALGALRRPAQRLEGLTELAALAEAMGATELELEVMLRRAAALRLSGDHDIASDLARRVRERAHELDLPRVELSACIELGQDLLRADLGEAAAQTPSEGDLDGAEDAYRRAVALAEQVDHQATLAAALRELGVVLTSRVRAWFVAQVASGAINPAVQAIVDGAAVRDLLPSLPIAPWVGEGLDCFRRALAIYERLGDRRGVMATVIAMASLSWGPGIHLGGSVRHIEELRRLYGRAKAFTRESERVLADAQMVFGAHVYALLRGFAGEALAKGQEAYRAARGIGDQTLEFAAAGGMALQHAALGNAAEAAQWLARAGAVATAAPTPFRAVQLEWWSGVVAAEAGEPDRFLQHMTAAARLAEEHGRPALRSEVLSHLATHAALLGRRLGRTDLLDNAEQVAREVEAAASALPGHPPFRARALAVRASVALARGAPAEALPLARDAVALRRAAFREELALDILLPAAEVIVAVGTDEERAAVTGELQLLGGLIAQRITDEGVRVRWFASNTGRALVALAGPITHVPSGDRPDIALDEQELRLLRFVTEARSNAEIAEALHTDEQAVASALAALFGKIGVRTHADAAAAAVLGGLV